MGSYAALAQESYAADHFALFSSELLRDYFRRHGIGVFTAGRDGEGGSIRVRSSSVNGIRSFSLSSLRLCFFRTRRAGLRLIHSFDKQNSKNVLRIAIFLAAVLAATFHDLRNSRISAGPHCSSTIKPFSDEASRK